MAARQDYRAFYIREIQNRRRGLNPPFTTIARLLVTANDDSEAETTAKQLEDRLNAFLDEGGKRGDIVQMRALEAPLKRIRGEARWQVFIKMYSRGAVGETLDFMEQLESCAHGGTRVDLEVNPANLR
jgi:primosomal protein N' (replication factor Y)